MHWTRQKNCLKKQCQGRVEVHRGKLIVIFDGEEEPRVLEIGAKGLYHLLRTGRGVQQIKGARISMHKDTHDRLFVTKTDMVAMVRLDEPVRGYLDLICVSRKGLLRAARLESKTRR